MITRSEILRRLRFVADEAATLASEIAAMPPPKVTPTVAEDTPYTGERPMRGRHIAAPSAGRCAVCRTPYARGEMVVWDDDARLGACPARCGVPCDRGAR